MSKTGKILPERRKLEKQPLFDAAGEPISHAQFVEKIEAVWTHLPPPKGVDVKPIVTKVDENEGTVTAVITWRANDEENRSNPSSGFNPAHMVGWDVVQTSLLDDLLTMLNESAGLS